MPRRLDPLAALLAASIATLAFNATAAAVEPADDHPGGATTLGRGALGAQGAIERPGDSDWYAHDLNPIPHGYDGTGILVVTRTGGTCATDALRATVFSIEGHAMLWEVVAPGEPVWLNFTEHRAGRYLIEIDAAGEEGCSDVTYTVSGPTSVVLPVTRKAGRCGPEQGALNLATARVRQDLKNGAKSRDARTRKRYRGYLPGDRAKAKSAKSTLAACRKRR